MLRVNYINWIYYLLYLRNELVYHLRQKLYLHRIKLNKKMQLFYFLKYVHFFGKAPRLIPARGLSIQCSFKHKIHLVSSGMDKSKTIFYMYWLCTPTLILWLYIDILFMERDQTTGVVLSVGMYIYIMIGMLVHRTCQFKLFITI